MIKVKGAFNAESGKMLEVHSSFMGDTTLPAAIAAMGGLLGRMLHHTESIHGDKAAPDDMLVEVCQAALETYDELPEITKEISENAQDLNEQDDTDPDYTSRPSGDDKQTVTAALVVRANGYPLVRVGTGAGKIAFDDLPEATAGLLGALSAVALTGLCTPAAATDLDTVAETFKSSWDMNIPLGRHRRLMDLVAAHQRQVSRFVRTRGAEER